MNNYKRLVKITFNDIINNDITEILVYEDGYVKCKSNNEVFSKKLLPSKVKKIKIALNPFSTHPQDYIKIFGNQNCKITILITNPFKKRPYTKVVNDKILCQHLLDIIKN